MIRIAIIALALVLASCDDDDKPKSRPGHIEMSGGFTFPQCSSPVRRQDGIHYVTRKVAAPLSGTMSMTYEITGDGALLPTEGTGPRLALYLQRRGDDWTAKGTMAVYRWWSKQRIPLTPGVHTITVPLDHAHWGPVQTSPFDTPAMFGVAVSNASRIGFTLGGSVGAGHGVCAHGAVGFTVKSFAVG